MLILTAVAIMAAVLLPDQALAWGGGIHLQTGIQVLENLGSLPAAIAALLANHPRDYLYGCIAADIIVGKKYTHYMLNCHRWRIGMKVLQAAGTDSEKACAYGYLSHLAADVIAHNYYVPYKIMRSFATVTMKHTYWEMRFETFVDKQVWERANEVCRSDQRGNDALLRSVLANTIFSFGTNKRIFNSIMLLSRLEKWQSVMQTLSSNSRYLLSAEDRDEYMELTRQAVFSFLREGEKARIVADDPTGEQALKVADAVRKNLRLLYKSGRITKADGMDQVEALRITLRDSLNEPQLLKQLYCG